MRARGEGFVEDRGPGFRSTPIRGITQGGSGALEANETLFSAIPPGGFAYGRSQAVSEPLVDREGRGATGDVTGQNS